MPARFSALRPPSRVDLDLFAAGSRHQSRWWAWEGGGGRRACGGSTKGRTCGGCLQQTHDSLVLTRMTFGQM